MNKRSFFLFFFLTAFILLGQYIAFRMMENREINDLQMDNLAYVTRAGSVISDWLWKGLVDTRYLSTIESVQLSGADFHETEKIALDFSKFLESIAIYDHIRLLDLEGMERVRVDYQKGKPAVIRPSKDLQDKSDRYYFIECNKISVGEYYVSPMDLNIENTEIEIPYKPMIRICTPIADQEGKKIGFLILNYLASTALNRFSSVDENLMLVNSQGYWLYSPIKEDEWGFMFGSEETFRIRYPEEWRKIESSPSGSFKTEQGVWTYSRVNLSDEILLNNPQVLRDLSPEEALHGLDELGWVVISRIGPETLGRIRKEKGMVILFSSLIIYPLAYFGMWNFNQRIKIEREAIEQVRFMGTHDMMTGLLNRAVFDAEIDRLNSSRLYPVSIFILDANNLKVINDTYGHPAGDRLIKSIGTILKNSFRAEDIVARLGGDEFGVLLPEVNLSACQALLERLQDNIEMYNRNENVRKVEVAIGTATSTEHEDLHLLLKRADEQMYAEKVAYKNNSSGMLSGK